VRVLFPSDLVPPIRSPGQDPYLGIPTGLRTVVDPPQVTGQGVTFPLANPQVTGVDGQRIAFV
jgi:hypothetical protein